MTDEQKARDSAANMGHVPPNKGVPMTDAQKAVLSAAHMGKQMGHPKYGPKYPTAETRAKMSASRMGHPTSPETRAKISAAHIGLKASLEAVAKSAAGHWKGGLRVNWARTKAKRRLFGFNALNNPFPGCEGHHTNNDDVIYMPKALHRSIYHRQRDGRGMVEMNALAGAFLTEDWT